MKPFAPKTALVAATVVLLLSAVSQSFASGGGGGGSSSGSRPSQSVPKFDPAEKYQEGVAAIKAGDAAKAEKAFKKVLTVTKKDANTNYLLGLSQAAQKKFKKAQKPLKRALKYDPDLISARGLLGRVYTVLGKTKDASKQRKALVDLQTKCGDCQDKAKINAALLQIDNAEAPTALIDFNLDQHSGDQLYLAAVAQINRGDYKAALSELYESAKVFGPHPDVLTYQGFANRKLGNREQALSYYTAALSIDDEHRGANEYLGEYYVEIGNLPMAKKQLAKLETICDFGCEEADELRRWIVKAS